MTLKILSPSAQTPSSPQPTHPPHSPFCCRLSSSSSQCKEFSSRAGIPEKTKPTFPFKIKKLQRKEKQCADLHRPRGTAHTCRGTIMGPPTAAVSPLVTFQALVFSLLECNERPLPYATSMETDLQPRHTCTHRTPSPWKNTNTVQGCSRGPAAPAKRPNNGEDCV